MSELTRRVLFSIVAAPVALAAIWFGEWALAALLAVAAAIAAWEYFGIARAAGQRPFAVAGAAAAGLVPIVLHGIRLGVIRTDVGTIALVAALATFAAAIWKRWPEGRPIGAVATTIFGVGYTGLTVGYAYVLRYHPYTVGPRAGAALLALPLVLTWTSDIGAYFVGRALGRRKLIPAVSPGKTIAGAVGAVVLCMLVAAVYERLVLLPYASLALRGVPATLPLVGPILFGAVVSVAAQVGDLAESLIKREAGVKDASHILPGHGGVLDRLDSLFFVLPVAHLLFGWLLIPAFR